ncbi:MAG: hypothetical protein L6416_03465 [Candidatus Omnitrophica bacterium]|nr:hypothetical protein [Candidatus Omnitrophota bacterium]
MRYREGGRCPHTHVGRCPHTHVPVPHTHVPVRLRKPTAKRFKKEQIGEEKTPEIKEHYGKAILEIGRVVRLLKEKKNHLRNGSLKT